MKRFLLYFFFLLHIGPLRAQLWHFPHDKKVVIPFDFVDNLILLSVKLNGEPLSFLLDNGVKETLLFGQVDSVFLKNTSAVTFQGFGIGRPIQGMVSLRNKLEVGTLIDSVHHLYVITDTSFNLSRNIGIPIHGILGSLFFRSNVVAIDYIKKKITVAHSVSDLGLKVDKYDSFPLILENDRVYTQAHIETKEKRFENQKLLLDLGNSNPMMLFQRQLSHFVILPPYIREYLGMGFNGAVFGYKNRIKSLRWAKYVVEYPIVAYPDSNSYDPVKISKNRVGSIGNQILSRFHVILDYPNQRIYLRVNKNFHKPYVVDMSGLEIVHDGFEFVRHRTLYQDMGENERMEGRTIVFSTQVNYLVELHATYIVNQVRPNSPAEQAGIQIGDQILKINGRMVGKMKLQDIKAKLQSGEGKRIKMQIRRGDKELNISFELEDPLSLQTYKGV